MNIYNIPAWAASTTYVKNSIVTVNNLFYYALSSHVSSSSFATDSPTLWGGNATSGRTVKPYFLWTASYNYRNTNQPRVKTIQMGDGYRQDLSDGINNLLLSFDFSFENIDLNQYSAILHFLGARAGSESFLFVPPEPYSNLKKFKCQEWNNVQNFYDNYSITAKFIEVVI